MQVSPDGRRIIEAFEGCMRAVGNGMYAPYHDEVGVLTQGYGHTNLGGIAPRVTEGVYWTKEQCDLALSNDLDYHGPHVEKVMAGVSLSQSQFDALASFDFNTGALQRSTIPAKLRAGFPNAAINTLLQYNHAGGVVLAGLTRRRHAEAALMRNDVPTALKIAGLHSAEPQALYTPRSTHTEKP